MGSGEGRTYTDLTPYLKGREVVSEYYVCNAKTKNMYNVLNYGKFKLTIHSDRNDLEPYRHVSMIWNLKGHKKWLDLIPISL